MRDDSLRNVLSGPWEPPSLKSGGGDGTSDDMEARVSRLEDMMKDIREDLKGMRGDMTSLRVDVAEVKGRLSTMPTTIQLLGFVVAIFIAAGLLKYFAP